MLQTQDRPDWVLVAFKDGVLEDPLKNPYTFESLDMTKIKSTVGDNKLTLKHSDAGAVAYSALQQCLSIDRGILVIFHSLFCKNVYFHC